MTIYDFRRLGKFLENELRTRELSQAELARMAGVTRSGINGVIKGTTRPSNNLLLAISKSLRISPEILYQEAGLLPNDKKDDFLENLNYTLSLLPPEDQRDVFDYINMKLSKNERKNHNIKQTLEKQKS